LSALGIGFLRNFLGQIEIIPADESVLEQTPTPFSEFLFDLFAIQEGVVVAERDGLRELMSIFAFVQLLFDRLPECHLINEAQQKVGLQNCAECFEGLIQGMVFRRGVEAAKEVGGRGFLQLDGGNKASHLVPLRRDKRGF
jgi:hypothetical protein